MDWRALLQHGWVVLREHWINSLISLSALVFGAWIGKRRAKAEWSKKRFLDRINFSLNSIVDGTLQIRTLVEKNCREVFLNDVAVERVHEAAKRTTAESALLPLDKDERWFMLNAVLNEISEQFADGFVRRDMGLPVQKQNYVICLTYENDGALMTRKIRAMVVRKDLFTHLPADMPKLERPHHATRYNTLRQLATVYQQDPSHFLDVEICI